MYVLVPVSTHSSDRVRCYMRVIWRKYLRLCQVDVIEACARARVYDTTI